MRKIIKWIKAICALILFVIIINFCTVVFVYNYLYPMKYKDEILEYSKEYDVDPYLVYSIINVESGFNPSASSGADARGLMQIRKITANWAREHIELEELNDDDYYTPKTNIEIGCWYLSKLETIYNDDITKVIAAYNAGTGNVDEWIEEGIDFENDEIPFEETNKYVKRVLSNIEVYKVLYGDNYTRRDVINASYKILQIIIEKASNRTNKILKTLQ